MQVKVVVHDFDHRQRVGRPSQMAFTHDLNLIKFDQLGHLSHLLLEYSTPLAQDEVLTISNTLQQELSSLQN